MPAGLLLSDDLLFGSRVTATARAHGLTVVTARTPARLLELAAADVPAAVVLDLQHPGLDLAAVVAALAALPAPPRLVGYGSHVDADALKQARRLGVLAMPRSQFAARLEQDLAGWLGRSQGVTGEPGA